MGDTEHLAAKLKAFMQDMDTRQKALEGHLTELSNSFLGKGKGSNNIGSLGSLGLENLNQKGSVEEYESQFQQLLARSSGVTTQQQVHLFMAGLKEEIKADLELQQPGNLRIAIVLAQALERKKMVSQGAVIKLQLEKTTSIDQDNVADVEMPLILYELNQNVSTVQSRMQLSGGDRRDDFLSMGICQELCAPAELYTLLSPEFSGGPILWDFSSCNESFLNRKSGLWKGDIPRWKPELSLMQMQEDETWKPGAAPKELIRSLSLRTNSKSRGDVMIRLDLGRY